MFARAKSRGGVDFQGNFIGRRRFFVVGAENKKRPGNNGWKTFINMRQPVAVGQGTDFKAVKNKSGVFFNRVKTGGQFRRKGFFVNDHFNFPALAVWLLLHEKGQRQVFGGAFKQFR